MTNDVAILASRASNSRTLPVSRSKQYFILASTPFCHWRRLGPLMQGMGLLETDPTITAAWVAYTNEHGGNHSNFISSEHLLAATPVPSLIDSTGLADNDKFHFFLEYHPDTYLLLLHTRPEIALVRAMEAGLDPVDTLNSWRSCADDFLRIYRSNRSRVSLVDVERALASPDSYIKVCQNYLGLPANGPIPEMRPDHIAMPGAYRLIAAQLISQLSGLHNIIDELEASSLPVGEPFPQKPVDCRKVFRDYQNYQAQTGKLLSEITDKNQQIESLLNRISELSHQLGDHEKKATDAEKDSEEILLQLHQTQEDLETYYLKSERDSAALLNLEQKYRELLATNESVKQSLDYHKSQTRKLKNKMETTRSALQSRRERMAILERSHRDQNRILKYMVNSRSWNITAPLRALYHRFFYKPGRNRSL